MKTTKTYKEKPVKQTSLSTMDKDKNLVLNSIKHYKSGETRTDTVKVTASELRKVNSIKKGDVESFRDMFYPLTREDKLKIDGTSEAKNLCKHARARQHVFNPIAKAAGREDLIVEYGKNGDSKPKAKKTVKAKAKKAPAKKVQPKKEEKEMATVG